MTARDAIPKGTRFLVPDHVHTRISGGGSSGKEIWGVVQNVVTTHEGTVYLVHLDVFIEMPGIGPANSILIHAEEMAQACLN